MPINMAVFDGNAFDEAAMIRAIDQRPYKPNMLDQIIQFEPVPVTTDVVGIKGSAGKISLIQTTERGAPIEIAEPDTKNVRHLKIPRVAKGDKLYAHELANLSPGMNETEEMAVARVIDRKQGKLIDDVEMTEEHMRLGALSGIVLDADGSEIINYYSEFGVTPPSAIDLQLDDATQTIGQIRQDVGSLLVQPIARASGAGNNPRFGIHAVCGDGFWYALTGHPAIAKTYEGYAAAAALRDEQLWTSFFFAGVTWWHYRGSDDGSSIAITSDKAKVFPVGVPGMFQHVMGPANEMLSLIGQEGRRYYPFLEMDQSQKRQWAQPEIYAYPLFVNGRPDLVLEATV